ncbi:MAG: MFS transporter [Planctomycetota bacterium]|nr:MAG: MFS transporter [Planctomycetota bacterium]
MDPEEEIPVSCTQCSPPAAGEKGPRPSPGRRAKNLFGLWIGKAELNGLERSSFRFHVGAAVLYGIFFSIQGLGAYLMTTEQMGATEFQITLYFSLSMATFIFSTVGSFYLTWRNHRSFMVLYSILGPLSLIGLMFNQNPYFFIGLIVWVNLNHAMFLPAQNMVFRSNYRGEVRGVLYARAQMVRMVIAASTALSVGYLLHRKPEMFTYVFAVSGIIGMIGLLLFSMMPRNTEMENRKSGRMPKAKGNPFADFFQIMRRDRFFRKYETYFFMYGIAFMMTHPLVAPFVKHRLGANWVQAPWIFVVIQSGVMIIFVPLFGRLLDRTNAVPVATLAFICLAFWPISLSVAMSIPFAYVAAFFFGLGMAGVDIAWMLGAQTFATKDKIQSYHAVHVTLVGLRAIIAPFVGYGLMRIIGYHATFAFAGCLFLLAAMFMIGLNRQRAKSLKEQGNKEE